MPWLISIVLFSLFTSFACSNSKDPRHPATSSHTAIAPHSATSNHPVAPRQLIHLDLVLMENQEEFLGILSKKMARSSFRLSPKSISKVQVNLSQWRAEGMLAAQLDQEGRSTTFGEMGKPDSYQFNRASINLTLFLNTKSNPGKIQEEHLILEIWGSESFESRTRLFQELASDLLEKLVDLRREGDLAAIHQRALAEKHFRPFTSHSIQLD